LRQGGSAADAAIVAALVAGVASPTSSGIGGGGFAVGWDAKTGAPYVLDFRERAPAAAQRDPFERRPLERKETAHLTGVPGEVRGLFELHKRAGKLRWADLVNKAADRAKNGFPVARHLGGMLAYAAGKLKPLPGFSALYYPGGKPAPVGSRLTNPRLAATLARIANEGPKAFYEGPVAENIVATAREHGSQMTLADLANYRPKVREPLHVKYEGYDVYTMPPPSAGGLMMVQALKMFPAEYLRLLGHGSPAYQHVLSEALRGAVADRMRYIGDPDFQEIDLQALVSDERMEERRKKISLDRTHSIPRFGLDEKGTHALVTSDRGGNVISLTTTINHLFGAKIMAEDSGVVLNNELDDFGSRAQVAPFGMKETPNRLRPMARPVSSMTPTVVTRDGHPVLALGGSGGTAIATNATQTLLAALVFGHDPKTAVSADRFYIPTSGGHLMVEKGTNADHIADLEDRGEIVGTMPYSSTAIQMLRFDQGLAKAGADPRKYGLGLVNGR
jgi:gamma-glutamyltranspeptidase/glutathione hydrolase